MSDLQQSYTHDEKLLDYEELQTEARKLVQDSDMSQSEIADELGVTRSIVGKAITLDPGPRYTKTQVRIIELLTDFDVQEEVRFRVVERGEDDA